MSKNQRAHKILIPINPEENRRFFSTPTLETSLEACNLGEPNGSLTDLIPSQQGKIDA